MMALHGQATTQVKQPTHFSASTVTMPDSGSFCRAPVRQDNCPVGGIPLEIPSLQTYPAQAHLRQDVSHTVAPGETLWRISKMYDVGIEDIARANSLKDISRLETTHNISDAALSKIRVSPVFNSQFHRLKVDDILLKISFLCKYRDLAYFIKEVGTLPHGAVIESLEMRTASHPLISAEVQIRPVGMEKR